MECWKEMGEEMMHNWESKDGDLEEEEEEEEAGRIRQVHLLLWKKLPLTPALYSPKMEFIHSVISVVCFHITERKKKEYKNQRASRCWAALQNSPRIIIVKLVIYC